MKKQTLTLAFAALFALTLSNCAENPADDVVKAEVEETSPAETKPAEEAPPGTEPVTYVFTEGSKIGFVGSKVTGSHEGGFTVFEGYFAVAGEALAEAEHKVVIDMASTFSDSEKLTGHLKSPDFFDVETFPESTFVLTGVTPKEGDTYTMTGDFTLHGVTKKISFPAEVKKEGDTITMKSEFVIDRFDFGIKYPGKADDLIRKDVVIKLDMVAKSKDA